MPYRNPSSFFEDINDVVEDIKNQHDLAPQFQDLIALVKSGTMNPNEIYAWASEHGYNLSVEDEKFIDNAISSWNTEQSQNWQEDMRDTSITSTANQYEQIGLSGSNVLQGQVANTPNTMAASNSKVNLAEQKAQRKLAMTQTMVNLIKGLASAGIGGGALMAARKLGASSGLQAVSALGASSRSSVPSNPEPISRDFIHWLHNY